MIRGVPGSGKTTMARKLVEMDPSWDHWETDMYFTDKKTGEYRFDPKKLPAAHKWCQRRTAASLKKGRNVVVSNTFIRRWELDPYIRLSVKYSADLEYETAMGNYENIHGVPEATIEAMKENMEGL